MSLLQRAARLVALSLTLAGVLGSSTIGHANEVERSLAPSGITAPPAVPQLPQPTPTVLADTIAVPTDAPKVRFASLAAAVAAQGIRCLAGAIYFESKGESLAGQLAVAEVVLNRTESGRFPPDVCGVVTQRGQFSFVRNGTIPAVDAGNAAYRRAVAVAKVALADVWHEQVPDALYFNGARAGHGGSKRIAAIGNHAFYR